MFYDATVIHEKYLIKVEMKRSFLNKDLTKQVEINMISRVRKTIFFVYLLVFQFDFRFDSNVSQNNINKKRYCDWTNGAFLFHF